MQGRDTRSMKQNNEIFNIPWLFLRRPWSFHSCPHDPIACFLSSVPFEQTITWRWAPQSPVKHEILLLYKIEEQVYVEFKIIKGTFWV